MTGIGGISSVSRSQELHARLDRGHLRRDLNKPDLVKKIIAALAAELDGYLRSARAAHAEATDDQSKAENKYDTRGLEASYLARGQSRQAAEVTQAMQQYEALALRPFTALDPIELGAIVELERNGVRTLYFVGPRAGGTEVECDGRTVLVITPQSPMGQQLVGRKTDDRLRIDVGGSTDRYRVSNVS
jgi:transcription elongation GreA/GreB family factor